MSMIKKIQIALLLCSVAASCAINAVLGVYIYDKFHDMRGIQTEISKQNAIIAESHEKVVFYRQHAQQILQELRRYRGVDVLEDISNRPSAKKAVAQQDRQKAIQARAQQMRNNQLKAQREGKQARQRPGKPIAGKGREVPQASDTIKVNAPQYLSKFTIRDTGVRRNVHTVELASATEFFRFLEWYNYFFSKYPFSVPEQMTVEVSEKNTYGNLPTNVTVHAVISVKH